MRSPFPYTFTLSNISYNGTDRINFNGRQHYGVRHHVILVMFYLLYGSQVRGPQSLIQNSRSSLAYRSDTETELHLEMLRVSLRCFPTCELCVKYVEVFKNTDPLYSLRSSITYKSQLRKLMIILLLHCVSWVHAWMTAFCWKWSLVRKGCRHVYFKSESAFSIE